MHLLLFAVDHRADRDRGPTRERLPAAAAAGRVRIQRRRRRWRRGPARAPRRARGCARARSRRVRYPAAGRAVDRQVTRTRRRARRRSRRRRRAVPDRDRHVRPAGRDPATGSPIPLDCIRPRHHWVPARSDTSEEATVTIHLLTYLLIYFFLSLKTT